MTKRTVVGSLTRLGAASAVMLAGIADAAEIEALAAATN